MKLYLVIAMVCVIQIDKIKSVEFDWFVIIIAEIKGV